MLKYTFINLIINFKNNNKKRALVNLHKEYCIGDPSTHFLYGIDYQQQHKSRGSN